MFIACGTQQQATKGAAKNNKELSVKTDKDGEYDIVVFDPGYDTFLKTKAFPLGYLSKSYLRNKNTLLVSNWNLRHSQPSVYNPNIYEVHIDYNSANDYSLEFEWKLFNFFMFVEWQTGVNIDGAPIMMR